MSNALKIQQQGQKNTQPDLKIGLKKRLEEGKEKQTYFWAYRSFLGVWC
jgi:hypothetical protein